MQRDAGHFDRDLRAGEVKCDSDIGAGDRAHLCAAQAVRFEGRGASGGSRSLREVRLVPVLAEPPVDALPIKRFCIVPVS